MSTSGGTVVYGCDSAYGKSADGILKIIQIILGFLAWAMFASLPYYKEVFVQGRTGVFHGTLALIIIPWLITLFFYVFRFSGWCIENKSVNAMMQRGGLLAQNVVCFLFTLIAGILLAQNMGKFDMGDLSYGYGAYNGGYNDNYQQGGTNNNRQSSQPNRSFGNCKTFNILDPYCRMRPDECNKLFQECMKFGQGQQNNKYYYTAVTCDIFIFIVCALYLFGAIFVCKEEGAELFGGEDEGNDVSFSERDMNRSMSRNSWKKSKNREEASIVTDLSPRDNSTMKTQQGRHLI